MLGLFSTFVFVFVFVCVFVIVIVITGTSVYSEGHKLSENIWFAWSKPSISGDVTNTWQTTSSRAAGNWAESRNLSNCQKLSKLPNIVEKFYINVQYLLNCDNALGWVYSDSMKISRNCCSSCQHLESSLQISLRKEFLEIYFQVISKQWRKR